MSAPRICIGPGDVAGYFSRLKSGFEQLGIQCEHALFAPNKFSYQESDYFLREIYQLTLKLSNSKFYILRFIASMLSVLLRISFFVYALFRYDVFIIPGFYSYFKFYDLAILRLLGKKVIVVYLGSDARPSYLSGKHLDDLSTSFDVNAAEKEASSQIVNIQMVERYADLIVNHTATGQFFKRSFIRLNALGTPIDVSEAQSEVNNQIETIRILHAPSRPLAKGSFYFRQIIEELRIEGFKIDFIELTGVPNSTVMKELALCDFVLDELYSDVPMAMFAAEAAMFGKPAVVGGYYAEEYKKDNPDSDTPPTLYVLPSEIKATVRKLIQDSEYRLALGQRAQNFVRQNWSPEKVASNYLKLIFEEVPLNWLTEPDKLNYYWGWGMSQENWKSQLKAYISNFGTDALFLRHHLNLQNEIVNQTHSEQDELIR